MLINISNHPSKSWTETQMAEAVRLFGEVKDMPFPQVPPEADPDAIERLANAVLDTVRAIGSPADATLHVMGEMTLTFCLVRKAKDSGYNCVASTTERIVVDGANGIKSSIFNFVKFRQYV